MSERIACNKPHDWCIRVWGVGTFTHGKCMLETMETAEAFVNDEKKVVAIVEDDPSMMMGLGRLLRAHGFVTEIYESAEAFLENSAASEVSCLLLDINLGGMSGIELRRRLEAAGSKVPVIFMTAIDTEAAERAAIQAGCIAYLRKPFPMRQLMDAIAKAVDGT